MSFTLMPEKDPDDVKPYFIVWCDPTGINTGATSDNGTLQGETLATVTWTVPTGITKDSDNKSAVTIHGVSYSANTVCTIWLSGGTDQRDYDLVCRITTSGSPVRTLDRTIRIPVRAQ